MASKICPFGGKVGQPKRWPKLSEEHCFFFVNVCPITQLLLSRKVFEYSFWPSKNNSRIVFYVLFQLKSSFFSEGWPILIEMLATDIFTRISKCIVICKPCTLSDGRWRLGFKQVTPKSTALLLLIPVVLLPWNL